MIRGYLSLIFIFCSQCLWAQTILSGKVQDGEGKPVPFASVQFFETDSSSMLTYALTNNEGEFVVRVTEFPLYYIKVKHLSYTQVEQSFLKEDFPLLISLEEKTNQLESVTIQAPKSAMEAKGDTVAYNLDLFLNGRENKLKDLLRKLPGIEITPDGKIMANGKLIKDLLVEGETVFGQNHSLLLETLNAEMVEGVQLLNNYERNELLRGLEEKEDVAMNISIKEDFKGVVTGDAGIQGATGKRAAAHLNTYRFDLKSNFALLGDANSLNRQVLSPRDYNDFKSQFIDDEFSVQRERSGNSQETTTVLEQNHRIRQREVGFLGASYGQKLNDNLTLKIFSLWSGQQSFQDQLVEREFLGGQEAPMVEEKSINQNRKFFTQTFLNLAYNKKRHQVKYDLVLDVNKDALNESLLTNFGLESNQNLFQSRDNNVKHIHQKLQYTRRIDKTSVLHATAFQKSDSRAYGLGIQSDFVLFNRDLFSVNQTFNSREADLGGYILYRKYSKTAVFGFYGGIDNQSRQFDFNNEQSSGQMGFNFLHPFVGTSFKKQFEKLKFAYDIKLNQIISREETGDLNRQLAFLPSIEASYNFSAFHSIQADANRSFQLPFMRSLVRGELFSDFRNVIVGSELTFNELSFVNELNFSHRFIDLYHGLIVYNFIRYTHQDKVFASSNDFLGNHNEINYQLAHNNTRKMAGSMVELRFSSIPLSFKTTNVLVNADSKSFLRGQPNNLEILSFNTKNEIRSRLPAHLPIIAAGFNFNSSLAKFSASSQTNTFLRWEPFTELNYGYKESLEWSLYYGYQKFSSLNAQGRLNILNIEMTYRKGKDAGRWDFGLVGQDILNLGSSDLIEVSNSPIQLSRSVISRFPGYLGVKVTKGF